MIEICKMLLRRHFLSLALWVSAFTIPSFSYFGNDLLVQFLSKDALQFAVPLLP